MIRCLLSNVKVNVSRIVVIADEFGKRVEEFRVSQLYA